MFVMTEVLEDLFPPFSRKFYNIFFTGVFYREMVTSINGLARTVSERNLIRTFPFLSPLTFQYAQPAVFENARRPITKL